MSGHAGPSDGGLAELIEGRPGWRLEPRSTPGATPVWCFVFAGKIEFSVSVDVGSVVLYVMETDREIVFKDADELMAWLRSNRAEALQEPASRSPVASRVCASSSSGAEGPPAPRPRRSIGGRIGTCSLDPPVTWFPAPARRLPWWRASRGTATSS